MLLPSSTACIYCCTGSCSSWLYLQQLALSCSLRPSGWPFYEQNGLLHKQGWQSKQVLRIAVINLLVICFHNSIFLYFCHAVRVVPAVVTILTMYFCTPCLTMPHQITCASALPGKTGKRENCIFPSNGVLVHCMNSATCLISSIFLTHDLCSCCCMTP